MNETVTNVPLENAKQLFHRRDCTRADVRGFLGRFGDVMLRCETCGRFRARRDLDPAVLGLAPTVVVSAPPGPELVCVRCDRGFPVRPRRATVPVCRACREKAEAVNSTRSDHH